jgi:hypothetical protein
VRRISFLKGERSANGPVKLPFPMTLGFKSLLSRDIAMPDLDVRWVSSVSPVCKTVSPLTTSALSWYFLNLFGLNGVFRLILGNENGESTSDTAIKRKSDAQLLWTHAM